MSSPGPDAIPHRRELETAAEDTFKILLATDNHIGYNERDPIRGQDSINTFAEILELAVKNDVDFVLLGGDLFHENRPSRDCLYKTMALLREHTLGTKPIAFELLSDPDDGKADGFSFPAINHEDQNINVGLPIFSIHGNHDDPQGAGPEGALCALDLLSVAGLVNYMGKIDISTFKDEQDDSAGIAVRPVLLRKGKTLLGLYGVGNVKDQRMNVELTKGRVRMYMPRNKHEWFNLLVVHQNRVKHGPHMSVPEHMFEEDVNLVVWGHEHDCRIVPEPVAGKDYFITQPGSSVATSLADGEAQPKHVALLKICGKEFSLEPIPLRTVRPFVLEEVVMAEVAEEEGVDLKEQMEINKFLRGRVSALIERANEEFEQRNAAAVAAGEKPLEPMLPLVRLKVDTTGVTEMSNPVRFGMEFQGQIANPRDVLIFHRAKKSAARGAKVIVDKPELSIDDIDPDESVGERIAKVRVETLVSEYLAAQELQLLGERGLSDAIKLFVDKDDPHSISGYVAGSLKHMLKDVKTNEKPEDQDLDDDELEEALMQAREREAENYQQRLKAKKGKGKARDDDDEDDNNDAKSVDSMAVDDDDFAEPPPPKKPAARGKKAATTTAATKAKAPAKGRAKKVAPPPSDSEEAEVIEIDDDDDDIEEDEPPPKKKTSRAAVLASSSKKAPTKKAPAKKATTAKQTTLTFSQPTAARSSRAAASRAKKSLAESDYDDDDD
ncbi:DNA repair exonuclease [Exidia glandulosa HHB12029]|uniref:Double-strand break repair protein n=1 Tax=Exidia glandulosa HHB12029 TaxID=1314781 RepID=A0A165N874_EXIGL|nr:DNA repair exonuclease [Exidia glandulosa HHB12029]